MHRTAVWRCTAILTMYLASASPTRAADVALRYLVERTPLRVASGMAKATVELHTEASCSAPFASKTLTLQDFQPIVDVKRVKLLGARPAPRVVELRHVMGGAPAVSTVYARVRGDGIVPADGTCQLQAFVPPPTVPWPIARDANGTPIGVLALMSDLYASYGAQTAVLRDDGHGVYGLAIGSKSFEAFEHGLAFSTADCSGQPFMPRTSVLEPTTHPYESDIFYGPGGPPSLISLGSNLVDYTGCFDNTPPDTQLAVPVVPLDLGRFVPPFRIDHAPPTP